MTMKVGYLQFAPVFGEVKRNLDLVAQRLERVECDLMVLPELFASGYQFVSTEEVDQLAESVPDGPTTQRLLEVARAKRMLIVGGLPERGDGGHYNSAVLVGPEGVIGVYRKAHLFFEETLWFRPGDTGFQVWDMDGIKIGLMICFDWYYPEAARTLALKGADIICHPSNLVLPNCPDSMPTRCLENRVFAITANRIGTEARGGRPPLTFIGSSEVVGPRGDILRRAARDQEEVRVVEIDPPEARNKRLNPYNDLLADRRPELYESE
ncbi:apolipoprotein N-acyltransferase [Nitrospira sp.]|nr:apolipoprotein N-acyltransferase [Nitrospira sp.]